MLAAGCAAGALTVTVLGGISGAAEPGGAKGAAGPKAAAAAQLEKLDRGLVSVHTGDDNLVSWRWLATDPDGVTFNLYRGGVKVNSSPITTTNYLHKDAPNSADYTVWAIVGGAEQPASPSAIQFRPGYYDVPISPPAGGSDYTYEANDASVGDLDGDGDLDFVLKWQPTNAKDNSQSGVTGNTIVDGYTLQGRRLWRIDLGRNIRSGAHYTQFRVYDYDGDGQAEIAGVAVGGGAAVLSREAVAFHAP